MRCGVEARRSRSFWRSHAALSRPIADRHRRRVVKHERMADVPSFPETRWAAPHSSLRRGAEATGPSFEDLHLIRHLGSGFRALRRVFYKIKRSIPSSSGPRKRNRPLRAPFFAAFSHFPHPCTRSTALGMPVVGDFSCNTVQVGASRQDAPSADSGLGLRRGRPRFKM